MAISAATMRRLTREAVSLNQQLGNPQSAAAAPAKKRANRVR
jgi:hypothetical protein